MTLQLASGFENFAPLTSIQFAAPTDGRSITPADVEGLLNNPATRGQ